jgi:putative ABC transport system substrate-binding protein
MKKVLATAAAIMMGVSCIGFAACDGNKGIKVNPDKENYVVGIVQLVAHEALDAATQGFKDALEAKLTEAGRTVEFDYQNAANDISLCSTIVNGFVAKDVDLIMANATPALQAAYAATETIPIMGTSITDYGVALGIENFNGTVGANVSGTSDLAPLDEQAEMMVDLLDLTSSNKVAILYCSSEPNSKYQADVVKAELAQKGITADIKIFVETNDISAVCNGIVAGGYDAVYVPTDNTVASNSALIDSILRPAGIPVFAGEEGVCNGCGFATLSISYYNIGLKVGEMAAEVLLGQKDIREMAIAYDQAPVKKYNATICADLGITVPNDYTVIAGTEVE